MSPSETRSRQAWSAEVGVLVQSFKISERSQECGEGPAGASRAEIGRGGNGKPPRTPYLSPGLIPAADDLSGALIEWNALIGCDSARRQKDQETPRNLSRREIALSWRDNCANCIGPQNKHAGGR
ncbi:hypothetical protein CDAR_527611 [Caerostris darwini]|uniref:Uncharacterized protein n=1 Tax=Caerostris darwini TaxID=1538125 RepID=A0AAV4RAX4_9ARAC|nr:hypothetical protein CDAR_527611 [Caerostris darwini]